jgi:triosephosphate isomerase
MRPLIAGNWKMHGSSMQLADIQSMAGALSVEAMQVDVLICPPFTLVERAARASGGVIAIGGQNCHHEPSGAFTGDISADMLKDAGASAVIVGHSERRQQHGETDSMIAAKVRAAASAELLTILCVGETQAQRSAGQSLAVCRDQIDRGIPQETASFTGAIGYEPTWAIGSGLMPTVNEIEDVHNHIRRCLVARLGADGNEVRILYGGSVHPDNLQTVLSLTQVGGVLVGESSLKVSDFESIVRTAFEYRNF